MDASVSVSVGALVFLFAARQCTDQVPSLFLGQNGKFSRESRQRCHSLRYAV